MEKVTRGFTEQEARDDIIDKILEYGIKYKRFPFLVWDGDSKTLKSVEVLKENGLNIQLTVESWKDEEGKEE